MFFFYLCARPSAKRRAAIDPRAHSRRRSTLHHRNIVQPRARYVQEAF
jgi:hypothetical protein